MQITDVDSALLWIGFNILAGIALAVTLIVIRSAFRKSSS